MPHFLVVVWVWCMATPANAGLASFALATALTLAREAAVRVNPAILAWEAKHPRVQALAAIFAIYGARLMPLVSAFYSLVTGRLLTRSQGGAAAPIPMLLPTTTVTTPAAPAQDTK